MSRTLKAIARRAGFPSAGPIGTIHRDSLPIFIYEPTLEQIIEYSELAPHRELGGFLIGGYGEPDGKRRPPVEIKHFLPAVDVHSSATSLRFTHDTWATMSRQVAERFPGESVLGWHHTHPNLGVFLSGYDLFIHRNFFGQPWHVAMVVDPYRHELCFFQWRGKELVDCGFFCIGESPPAVGSPSDASTEKTSVAPGTV